MSHADYWYAAQVQSGAEFTVEEEIKDLLHGVGTAYCPRRSVLKKRSRHAHGLASVEIPLFNKYLFVKFGSPFQNWGLVTSLKEVDGFVRANGYPLPIRPAEINKIRNECDAGAFNEDGLAGKIKAGDKVEVMVDHQKKSPFAGLEGVFQGLNSNHSATVELSLFGRLTRVEIPTELLERIV